MQTSVSEASGTLSIPLELVELELALNNEDCLGLGFEGALNHALGQVDGQIFFRMRLDGVDDCDWVAAVSVSSDGGQALALVVQRSDGEKLAVESIEASELPVAGIVSAYAGLMASLDQPQEETDIELEDSDLTDAAEAELAMPA